MPCDGGVGECRNEACGETACLNERGFCSDYCEDAPEFVEELREAVSLNQRALDRLAES